MTCNTVHTAEKPFAQLTLDEKWERLERDLLDWQKEWADLDQRDATFAARYGIEPKTPPFRMPEQARSEWLEIYEAQQILRVRLKVLEGLRDITEQQSRLPGIGGLIGRMLGRGRRPGSYKASDEA